MKRIIKFLKTDIKIINSYLLFSIILIILVCVGYSSYALFSFTKTSTNIIEATVGKLKNNIDTSGANSPVLASNMIPVYYDDGELSGMFAFYGSSGINGNDRASRFVITNE